MMKPYRMRAIPSITPFNAMYRTADTNLAAQMQASLASFGLEARKSKDSLRSHSREKDPTSLPETPQFTKPARSNCIDLE